MSARSPRNRTKAADEDKLLEVKAQLDGALRLLDSMNQKKDGGDRNTGDLFSELSKVHSENDRLRNKLNEVLTSQASVLEEKIQTQKALFSRSMDELQEEVKAICDANKIMNLVTAAPKPKVGKGRKVFTPRASLLSSMLAMENYQTIMNIGYTVFTMVVLNVITNDIYDKGVILDMSLWMWCFAGWQDMLWLWMQLFLASFLIVPIAHVGALLQGKSKIFPILLYVGLQIYLYYASSAELALTVGAAGGTGTTGLATGMALMCEQTRMSMKVHAYFRERVWWNFHGFGGKPAKNWVETLPLELSRFHYFMWIPTLVYRPSYPRIGPRTSGRFRRVLHYCVEALCVVEAVFIVFRLSLPQFQRSSIVLTSGREVVLSVLSCMLPGMALLFLAFFLVLHTVQNLFAEITGFADRQFYMDWWNSRTWAQYYRKWNGVVHDWIHNYLYLDLVDFFGASKGTAQIFAFGVSAVIHEYIITYANGYFFPILLILFAGPGVFFVRLTRSSRSRFWNVFMWLMLSTGTGVLVMLYMREFSARTKPIITPDWVKGRWEYQMLPPSWSPLYFGLEHFKEGEEL